MGIKTTTTIMLIAVLQFCLQISTVSEAGAQTSVRKESAKDEAKMAYLEGQKLYKAEEYLLALPFFRKAYELSNRKPTSILALAQCERMNKMYDQAIARFKEYLQTKPSNKQVGRVNETLKILERLSAQAKQDEGKRRVKAKAEEENRRQEAQRLAQELAEKMAIISPASPALSTTATPETNILSSPWLWIGVAIVAAAAGTAAFMVRPVPEEINKGSSGINLSP